MLEAAPAGTLNKWRAYYQAEPFGDDWQQASVIATQIINAIQSVAIGMGGKKPKKDDMLDWDAFVPKQQDAKKTKPSMQESLTALRWMCGV